MAAALLNISRRAQRFFLVFSEKPAVRHRMIHTLVWWDIDKFQVPKDCEPHRISANIRNALVRSKYNPPVSIAAYGNREHIPLDVQDALSHTGVSLVHVPDGTENTASRQIHADMFLWGIDHRREPADFLVITGDGELWYAIQKLGRDYNIFVASNRIVAGPMGEAARALWRWSSLSAGGPPEISKPLRHSIFLPWR